MLRNLAPVIDDSSVVFDGLLEERRENSGEMRRVRLSWSNVEQMIPGRRKLKYLSC